MAKRGIQSFGQLCYNINKEKPSKIREDIMTEDIKEKLSAIIKQYVSNADEQSMWQMLIRELEQEKLAYILEDIKKDFNAIKTYTDYFMKVKKAFEEGDYLKAEELFNDVLIEAHIKNYRKFLKIKLASWDLKRKLIREETGTK